MTIGRQHSIKEKLGRFINNVQKVPINKRIQLKFQNWDRTKKIGSARLFDKMAQKVSIDKRIQLFAFIRRKKFIKRF